MFYLVLNYEAQQSGFRPDCAASFLNSFKNIPGKACVNRNIELEISIGEKHCILMVVFYQLIKHRILIRRRFVNIKSLHVMYYQPFDRSMGL